jgi:hypothetical protein
MLQRDVGEGDERLVLVLAPVGVRLFAGGAIEGGVEGDEQSPHGGRELGGLLLPARRGGVFGSPGGDLLELGARDAQRMTVGRGGTTDVLVLAFGMSKNERISLLQ